MQKSARSHKDVSTDLGVVNVTVLPEGVSFKPAKRSWKPKQGLSGVRLDPEVVRNIGVSLLERACLLANKGLTPAGLLSLSLKSLLIDEIRKATADKRARYIAGGNREPAYEEVPGMANIVYSGEDLED